MNNLSTGFSSLEEYKLYLETKSLEDIQSIIIGIDKEKYPDRYDAVLQRYKILSNTVINNKPIEVVYAGFRLRLIANVIDGLLIMPFFGLLSWYSSNINQSLYLLSFFPIIIIIYQLYFNHKFGGTIGKIIVGIRIYKVNFNRITWEEVLKRQSIDTILHIVNIIASIYTINLIIENTTNLNQKMTSELLDLTKNSFTLFVNILSQIWFWSELFTLLFTKNKRALHDLIAGTVVAKKSTVQLNVY